MTTIHWFVEDTYYGQTAYAPRRFTYGYVRTKPYYKLAVCCRGCGSIWARVYSNDSAGWYFHTGLDCQKCGGGLLTDPKYVLEELVDIVPLALLKREFMIESERLIKEINNEPASTSTSSGA